MKNWKKVMTIIFSGQVFSLLTSSIVQFAIIWYLTYKTGSATVLAIATIAGILPQLVLGPFIGVFIDRVDRKKIMMLADSGIAIFSLILGILFLQGEVSHVWIYLVLFIRSLGGAFHSPSFQASVPLLVPEDKIVTMSGVSQTVISATNILGPVLGAMLFGILNIGYIMMLDVIGAMMAVGSLAFVKIPNPKTEKRKVHILKEMKEGIQEINKHKLIKVLTIFMVIMCVLYMPLSSLYPLITNNYFKLGAINASIVEMAFAVGMLIGGILLSTWGGFKNKQRTIIAATILLGITTFIIGMLPANGFTVFVMLAAIMGLAGTIFSALYTAILQMKIKPEVLGRVFSLVMSLMLLGTPVGLLLAVPIAESIGVQICFLTIGIAMVIISIVFACIPIIRTGEAKE